MLDWCAHRGAGHQRAARGPGTAEALDARTLYACRRRPMRMRASNYCRAGRAASARNTARGQGGQRPHGLIVLNQARVTLGPCAIAHGNLSVIIDETPVINQPNPLSRGLNRVGGQERHCHQYDGGKMVNITGIPLLSDVVRA